MITAQYCGRTVEIISVTTYADVKHARVRIVSGRPFISWSHGGWVDEDEKIVRADLLEVDDSQIVEFRSILRGLDEPEEVDDYDDLKATEADVRASLRSF